MPRRGGLLVAQGYTLNIMRGVLPNVLAYLLRQDTVYLENALLELVSLDILQFAGITFLLFALLKKFKATALQILGAAVAMLAIATFVPALPGMDTKNLSILSEIGCVFFYRYMEEDFPVFSWFVYPSAGYCFYYHQTLAKVLWILLICGIVYSVFYFVTDGIKEGKLKSLIKAISSKVNKIYIAQWIIIQWSMIFLLENTVITTPAFIALIVTTTCLSVGLVFLSEAMKKRGCLKRVFSEVWV